MLSLLIVGFVSLPTVQPPEKPLEPWQGDMLDDALQNDLVRREVVDGIRAFNRLVCLRPVEEDELNLMVVSELAYQHMLEHEIEIGGTWNDHMATILGAETVLRRMTDRLLSRGVLFEEQRVNAEIERWGDSLSPLDERPADEIRSTLNALGVGSPYRLAGFLVEYQDIAAIDFDARTPEQHARLRLLLPLVKQMLRAVVEDEGEAAPER